MALPKSLQKSDGVATGDIGEEKDGDVIKEGIKAAKAIHYDMEDLTSFHSLFLAKPLTKAC